MWAPAADADFGIGPGALDSCRERAALAATDVAGVLHGRGRGLSTWMTRLHRVCLPMARARARGKTARRCRARPNQ